MRNHSIDTLNRRWGEQSIRQSLLDAISPIARAESWSVARIREIDPKITRPQYTALRNAEDGWFSLARLETIAAGLGIETQTYNPLGNKEITCREPKRNAA